MQEDAEAHTAEVGTEQAKGPKKGQTESVSGTERDPWDRRKGQRLEAKRRKPAVGPGTVRASCLCFWAWSFIQLPGNQETM